MFPGLQNPKVLIITINYKSEDSLTELVRSLQQMKGFGETKVIIVDNSPAKASIATIRLSIGGASNIELFPSEVNRGYLGGAKFGLDRYLANGNDMPDWVIVSNHDVQIEDKEFFSKLLSQDPRAVGVIAPRVQALPGRADQNPFMRRRPGALRWVHLRFVSSNYVSAAVWDWLWRRKSALRSWLASRQSEGRANGGAKRETIYAAHGSFFIFSRRYFEAGGFLDGNLFLYGEEISVAEICRSLSLPVVYEPSLCVVHKEHQSTGRILNRFTYECQKKSLQYLTSRYWSGSQGEVGSCQADLSE